jgi:hypothetical protein
MILEFRDGRREIRMCRAEGTYKSIRGSLPRTPARTVPAVIETIVEVFIVTGSFEVDRKGRELLRGGQKGSQSGPV